MHALRRHAHHAFCSAAALGRSLAHPRLEEALLLQPLNRRIQSPNRAASACHLLNLFTNGRTIGALAQASRCGHQNVFKFTKHDMYYIVSLIRMLVKRAISSCGNLDYLLCAGGSTSCVAPSTACSASPVGLIEITSNAIFFTACPSTGPTPTPAPAHTNPITATHPTALTTRHRLPYGTRATSSRITRRSSTPPSSTPTNSLGSPAL